MDPDAKTADVETRVAGSARRRRGTLMLVASALLAATALSAFGASRAGAQTYLASNTEQLIEDVAQANANAGPNTIKLSVGGYHPEKALILRNTTGLQTIEGSTTFPGATLSGSSLEPVEQELLAIKAGVSLKLVNLTETNAGGGAVPALDDAGTLEVESSLLAGNRGASIHVEPGATATIHNSTLSDGEGYGLVSSGTTALFNSTVAFNVGGLDNKGTTNLTDTIVANNTGGDCTTKAVSTSDHSLDSDGSCGVGLLSNRNPLLGKAAKNGGPTLTHALEPGSPAIDAADEAACPATDQRGFKRPDIPGTACDIGAFEFQEVVSKPPPSVETKVASSVTQVGATLNATVNPNGSEVSACTFEYGTETTYGKTASCSLLPGSGFVPVSVSAAITGLSANTTYHFRISATNAGGKSEGADAEFKTTAEVHEAPSVETKVASSVTQVGATLNATVNPNGSEVSACTFEYGTETTYGKTAPCATAPGSGSSPVSVSAAITGLSANTTYHFRISATNAGGKSEGADAEFKTTAEVHEAPSVETKVASSVTQVGATLNATVNPNGSEVSACTFEYGTETTYGKTAPCATAPGSGSSPVSVSAAITGLSANTTYHFRISATNAGGKSEGADAEFKTTAEVHEAPSVETKVASSVTQVGATLNATVNPNGSEVSACTFEYGTETTYGKTAPCATATGSGSSPVSVSAAITGLSANTTYHFRISATNAGGKSEGADAEFKTPVEVSGGPVAAIYQLLLEVGAAEIPHRIRSGLSRLLTNALHEAAGLSGAGSATEAHDQLSASEVSYREHDHDHDDRRRVCETLDDFVELIARDQGERRPDIPAALATAWTQAARGIEASMSCRFKDATQARSDGESSEDR